MPTKILMFSFIVATLACFITAIVLFAFKRRRAAVIFELFASAFFVAYTTQYIVGLNYLDASTYTFEGFARLFLFILSVIFLIYKVVHFIKYRS